MSLFKHPVFMAAVILTSVVIALFIHNLPHWCANPSGNGNWMIVPFCTK